MESFRKQRKGIVLFSKLPVINKKIPNIEGLTDAKYKEYFKILGDVAPVRRNHGRSMHGRH